MNNNTSAQQPDNDFIDLTPYISALWRHKIRGIALAFVLFWVGLAASFTRPVIYTAEMVVAYAPNRDADAGAANFGKLGALGALGSNFGLGGMGGRLQEDLATLRSNQFTARFIASENLAIELVAKSWNIFSQQMEANDKLYDSKEKELTRRGKLLIERNAHIRQFSNLVDISEDKRSTLVTIRLSWWQREKSQQLLRAYLDSFNNHIREIEIGDAQRNINFLMQQVNATDIVELKKTFFGLIETQQKKIMLAQTRADYAFRIIDPPLRPFRKSAPARLTFAAAGSLIGIALFTGWIIFSVLRQQRQTDIG